MLLFPNTTDKLQLTTSSTADIDVHVSYVDKNQSTGAISESRQLTAINTAATTDIMAAPGATTTRNAKTINIRNKHASASNTVTVIYDANGTDYELYKVNLLAGDVLNYVEGIGWFVYSSNYALGTGGLTVVKLASDQSNSTSTPTEVTGLSVVNTGTGVFVFNYYILYQAAAATTGVKFDINHTGTLTAIVWNQMFVGLIATAADANADQDAILAAANVYNSFASRGKGTAGRGVTLTVDTGAADMLMRIEGLMIVSVDGDLELWHGSEVAAASTIRAGSSLLLVKTGT